MKQVTYTERGRLRWDEVPDARLLDAGDALVRPVAAARCDLDVGILAGAGKRLAWGLRLGMVDPCIRYHLGPRPLVGPFAFGHECVATVEACGPQVTRFSVGDLVVVPFQISCGHCARCRRGLTALCETVPSTSMFGVGRGSWGGALSDLVRVPFADAMLVAVPTGVDPVAVASASDNLPDAWRLVAPHLQRWPGSEVLVMGGGARSIGLYAAAVAVALGASRVDYVDDNRERLEIAARVGARPLEGLAKDRYPIVVDATANERKLVSALHATAVGGVCASAGIYFRKRAALPLLFMHLNGITLLTAPANARAEIPAVLECVASGKVKPELVTTRIASWDDAPEAFFDRSTKVVVHRSHRR